MPIEDHFRGKRVIVTGHTGFKGVVKFVAD